MRQEASRTHSSRTPSDSKSDHGLLALAARQSGFTLIEIMLVLVIMAVLLAIATATFLNQSGKAHATAIEVQLTNTAHSATYEFTSYGKGVFPKNTIAQLAHSEPELNITCGDTYVKGQVSVYFKDTSDCTPSTGAHVLDLRGVSADGTYYVEQLNYTSKQRKILKLKGEADSTTNYIPDPSFEGGLTGWHVYASAPPGYTKEITSTWASSGDNSLHISADIPAGKYLAVQPDVGHTLIGDSISARATVNVHSITGDARINLYIFFFDGDGGQTVVADTLGAPATGVHTLVINRKTVPVGAVSCALKIQPSAAASGPGGSVDFDVDSVLLTEAPTAPPYFDGSYPDATWNGAANNSSSTGYAWDGW